MSVNRIDWRRLAFELLVVFIGLLAALQVEDYRERREFREDQRRYLVRMEQDLRDYEELMNLIIPFLERIRDSVDHVWRSIQANEIVNGDVETFEYGLIYIGHLPSNPLPRGTYDEMVASGMFTALESGELQRAISRLYSQHAFVETNFAWWRQNFLHGERYLLGVLEFYDEGGQSDAVPMTLAEPHRRVRFDLEKLRSDLGITNHIYWARDVRSDWVEWSVRMRDGAAEVRRMLERELAGSR